MFSNQLVQPSILILKWGLKRNKMKTTKFKSGDFVENIHTGEIEMVDQVEILLTISALYFIGKDILDWESNYRPISSKQILIRDKQLKE